jgi:hypothetical protein
MAPLAAFLSNPEAFELIAIRYLKNWQNCTDSRRLEPIVDPVGKIEIVGNFAECFTILGKGFLKARRKVIKCCMAKGVSLEVFLQTGAHDIVTEHRE